MKLILRMLIGVAATVLLGGGSQSWAGDPRWRAGFGQGTAEYSIRNRRNDEFYLYCASDGGRRTSGWVSISGATLKPYEGSTIRVAIGGQAYQLTTWKDGQFNTFCRACAANFTALWHAIRRGRAMQVTLEDGPTAVFSLAGSARALPAEPCKTDLELVAYGDIPVAKPGSAPSANIKSSRTKGNSTASSGSLPTDKAVAATKRWCARKWPANYRMQLYCLRQQGEAASWVGRLGTAEPLSTTGKRIVVDCHDKWQTDEPDAPNWRMIKYCIEQQIEAAKALGY